MPETTRWDLGGAMQTARPQVANRDRLIPVQIVRVTKALAAISETAESLVERLKHVSNAEAPTPSEEKPPCFGIVMADELREIGDTAERTLVRLHGLLERLEI